MVAGAGLILRLLNLIDGDRNDKIRALRLVVWFGFISVALGLVVASVIHRVETGRLGVIARTVLFLPQVIPLVAAGVIWGWLLALPGLINQILRAVGLGAITRAWLGDFDWALPAVGFIGIWVLLGFCVVLLLTGMTKVDPALYESGRIDGASWFAEFVRITIPLLRHEIGVCLTVTVIAALAAFDIVYVSTAGGPGTSTAVPGLIPSQELDLLVEAIHAKSGGQSRRATGHAASNLDLYQINCTYYDALGRNDRDYLIARAIQFFAPGIPQVYYVGLLAGTNDLKLLEETRVGRDINRHYYSGYEVQEALARPVVANLLKLIRFRNEHSAFQGTFSLLSDADSLLEIRWKTAETWVRLKVDFSESYMEIDYSENGVEKRLDFNTTGF
ncbi:MAG TPA: ABC transporter permease subunit [Oceanobacillus sp.]|nr:ABC transporter permease subunit [Oceanobacillus sp.]